MGILNMVDSNSTHAFKGYVQENLDVHRLMTSCVLLAEHVCAVPKCDMEPCDNALAKDEHGCEICECAGTCDVDAYFSSNMGCS